MWIQVTCIGWWLDPPRKGALLKANMRWPIVSYLRMANVPSQRARRTNPFAAARGDKTAMQPFAELLWTLVTAKS